MAVYMHEVCPSQQMWRGSQAWSLVKEAPLVSGATTQQLVAWLTYHRAIGESPDLREIVCMCVCVCV